MFETGKGFDWATAESLAFGTLLLTANHVKEQKFYIGTNLHVLCIPIQNQESTQSNMIYSSGLRSIIDLKEGRKTT